jgi:hypothetical protein
MTNEEKKHHLELDIGVMTLKVEAPNRLEKLDFRLELDGKLASEHLDDCNIVMAPNLVFTPDSFNDGDTIKLRWECFVQYFGEAAQKLAAINRLLDVPGIVANIELEELSRGQSLLVNVAQQIALLKAKL